MQVSIKFFVSLCAIYFLTTGLTLAEPADITITPDNCALLDEYGDPAVVVDQRTVSSNNANGNLSVTCSYDFEEKLDARRSVIWNFDNTGFTCGIPIFNDSGAIVSYQRTEDWHEVISASGKAKLSCHFHEQA